MLQGPHGPFFRKLAEMLRDAGHSTLQVCFNRGDEAFAQRPFHAFTGSLEDWPSELGALLADGVSDVVLYGEVRPIHAQALSQARALGLRTHIFEEGYLRPFWITYERLGTCGNSPVVETGISEMEQSLEATGDPTQGAPARWGELRRHVYLGALYHFWVLCANRRYAGIPPHRAKTVAQEFGLYLKKIALLPVESVTRMVETRGLNRSGAPYSLVLLQLEHDANFRKHSPFASQEEFIRYVIESFAAGAPLHHKLVFKTHPLEDNRVPLRPIVRAAAAQAKVLNRVHFIPGGKLGDLLDMARSAVTVNSTAAEQALWRGLPTRAFGRAVFQKSELTSGQPLEKFFENPVPPDRDAYFIYRRYLLATSQVPGGFYSRLGRARVLRHVLDLMLMENDPYGALSGRPATAQQHLTLVP